MGPFESVEACLVGLVKAYPEEAERVRVCAAMERRGGKVEGDARHDHAALTAAMDGKGSVTRGAGWVLIRGVVGTKAGVNDNGQWKTPEAIRAGWPSFDGVPVVYDHPKTPSRLVEDPATAAGFAVNTRLREADLAIVRDVLLFTERPQGFTTSDADLQRNAAFADLVEAGVQVHVSEGYLAATKDATGVAMGQDGSPGRAYREVQATLRGDHLAILAPLVPKPGACPVSAGCGAGVDAGMTPNTEQATVDAAAAEAAASQGKWSTFIDSLRKTWRGDARVIVDECAQKHLAGKPGGDSQEKNNMDEKQVTETVNRAVADALKPIQESLGKLAGLGDDLKTLKSQNDERSTREQAAVDAALQTQAVKVARLRVGTDAAKVEAEAKRLGAMGKAALDELEAVLSTPGHVDPTLLLGPINADDPFAVSREDGATYVRDWSKIPLPAQPFAKGVGK